MSFKTILTYLPTKESAELMMTMSLPIAEEHNAHLIGLHLVPILPVHSPVYGAGEIPIPEEVIEKRRAALEKTADDIKNAFEAASKNSRCAGEWRSYKAEYGKFTEGVIEYGKCADLIVMPQNAKDPYNTASEMSSRIVMETGRPTLIVPTNSRFDSIGRKILVAWNGSREAARAAFDALPLLTKADEVRVVSIESEREKSQKNFAKGDGLAMALARHGVKAEVTSVESIGHSIGEELAGRASEYNSDLLVMGCYGHSRLREMFFGGATASVLRKMPIPVLMSH